MNKFDISYFKKNGFVIVRNVITKNLQDEFNLEIKNIIKSYNNSKKKINNEDKFSNYFKKFSNRKDAYSLLQDLRSVKNISSRIDRVLSKIEVYKKLGFIAPAIKNGLIVSLPKENQYDNPLHQDIYNYHSKRFIKIWAPLTEVNLENGSMKVFKGSHKKGFVKPLFRELDYYPQISKNTIDGMNFEIFKFKPGPIVIFNPLVMHMSVPNISKKSL